MQKAAHAYLQTQVATTSQGALLLMLYDGAVNFLNQAKEKIAERDYAKKGVLISKAIDIVAELDACLNVQRGGDISDNLHRLYFYCNSRLLSANLKMNVAYIDEVIKILEGLRSAYAHILSPGDDAAAKSRLGAQSGAGEMAQTTNSVSGVSANAQAQAVMNSYAMQPANGQSAATGFVQGNPAANPAQAGAYGRTAGMNSFGAKASFGGTATAADKAAATPVPSVSGAGVPGQTAPSEQVAMPNNQPTQVVAPVEQDVIAAETSENATAPAVQPTGQQGFARSNAANMYKRLAGQI